MAKELLEGIRVLDMTTLQLGPVATMILAAMGAEVIKIEVPGGERARLAGGVIAGGKGKGFNGADLSSYFENNNRGKKNLVLDMKRPKAKEVLYQLVAKSDVFVQNMRHGAAERLGCDYNTLKKYNPKLIYASGTAFGSKGPDGRKAGMDVTAAARSGWYYMAPTPDGRPLWALSGSVDRNGATFLSYSIIVALLARERFGIGQEVETSLFTSAMWVLGRDLQQQLYIGAPLPVNTREEPRSAISNYYKCADGKWITFAAAGDRQWEPVCQALGIPESVYKDDPRFNTPTERAKHTKEAVVLFDEAFAKKTQDEWVKAFEGKDIFWERVQKFEDLPDDPQVVANEYMTDYDHPLTGETYKYLNVPIQLRETPIMRQGRAPLLGEHTEEILVDLLGYKKEDVPGILEQIGGPGIPDKVEETGRPPF